MVLPSLFFWKARKNSLTIGYQEKKEKQSTAPIRKPWAERLRCTARANEPCRTGSWCSARAGAGELLDTVGADMVAPRDAGAVGYWLASTWLTCCSAVASSLSMSALRLVRTPDITLSRTL